MIVIEFDISAKYIRTLLLTGILAAYAFAAYHLANLPEQWLGALMALLILASVAGSCARAMVT